MFDDESLNDLTHEVARLIEKAADIALTTDDLYRVNDVLDALVKEFTE